MAKILISSIGAGSGNKGEYRKATYEIDNNKYDTSIISDALNQHYKFDKILLVGTNRSIWDEIYNLFGGENEEYYSLLYEKKEEGTLEINNLKQFLNLATPIYPYIIDYGIDEKQIWTNFEKFLEIEKELQNEDEIYLDITNSFRSLAIMSFVMTQFSSTISNKKFQIKKVLYGMFEYNQENNGITPIVDLKILFEIQEWIKAIDAIKKYSDFEPLVNLFETANIEKKAENTFKDLNNTIHMSNMASMKRFISTAATKIRQIEQSNNKIIKLLAPEIKKIIDELNHEKLSDFQFALSKWFYKNKNYAMSYLALFEAVVSKTVEIKEPNKDVNDEEVRNSIKGRIDYPYNEIFLENKGKRNENLNSISSIRHSIAHQLDSRKATVFKDIERLKYFIDEFENYFKD